MEEHLTEIKDITKLILNLLLIDDLKMLSCVNKKINNWLKDDISKYDTCILVIDALNDIRRANIDNENRGTVEHLLLEMYYEMKKSNFEKSFRTNLF